jgi:DNA-binding transcriptional ArsR family regulator
VLRRRGMNEAPKVEKKRRADRRSIGDPTICEALKHPTRVRILEVLCDEDISPIRFLRRGLLPPGIEFEEEKNALSHVAYHFKELLKADCVVLAETVPRRGANEHIYRSKMLALHTDEDFEVLDLERRRAISRSTLQMLIARADGAIHQGTFDKRADRHLSWVPMELDEPGWQELRDLQAETLERAQGIKAAAIARKHERGEDDDTPTFTATFGALAFESPTVPA